MRTTFDELDPSQRSELTCVHVAHFEWEARRVAACLDASDVEYSEEAGPGEHVTAYFVAPTSAQRALRTLEYAGVRGSPQDHASGHGHPQG